jgi:integrase
MAGSVISYCSCRDPATGKRYPAGKCPKPPKHRKWMFKIDLPRAYDPATGGWKRQQLTRSFDTRREAERALEDELPRIRAGTAPSLADRQLTVAGYLTGWLAAGVNRQGQPWRPVTATSYRTDVQCYLIPGVGSIKLADLRGDHIRGMWAKMRSGEIRPMRAGKDGEPRPMRKRGRESASVSVLHRACQTLNTALNQAVLDGLLPRNPCVSAKVEIPHPAKVPAWQPGQVKALLAHAGQAEPHLAAAFMVAAYRGLRRGEIAGLKWSDYDQAAGKLHIRRNVTVAGRQVYVGEPKTKRSRRTVSVGPALAAVLRDHRKLQLERRMAAPEWHDEGWIFPGPDGRVLRPHVLTHTFQSLAAGVPGLPAHRRFHALRHTAVTSMILAGVPVHVVSREAGHATLAMTVDTYADVIDAQRDAAAAAVEALYE